jgi:hypothetical protein
MEIQTHESALGFGRGRGRHSGISSTALQDADPTNK